MRTHLLPAYNTLKILLKHDALADFLHYLRCCLLIINAFLFIIYYASNGLVFKRNLALQLVYRVMYKNVYM